jgi:dTDP-4-amino-4,6-dideoxygalactose transaminase
MTSEGFDTRLVPLAGDVRVPLYRPREVTRGDLGSSYEEKLLALRREVQKRLALKTVGEVFCSSASAALNRYLVSVRERSGENIRVALPSFSCPELLSSIVDAGAEPVFFDSSVHQILSESSISWIARAGVRVLIWPAYFGPSARSSELIDLCWKLGLKIILDEAQSFPGPQPPLRPSEAIVGSLVSFGPTKRIAGGGGGALLFHSEEAYREFCTVPVVYSSGAMPRSDRGPIFDRLDALLEFRGAQKIWCVSISEEQIDLALSYLLGHSENEEALEVRYSLVSESMRRAIGNEVVFLGRGNEGLWVPSIAAFWMPPLERHAFMRRLGRRGVQSTWYYFPLHLLSWCRGIKREEDLRSTEQLSAGCTIVPCQFHRSIQEVEELCSAIVT